MMFYQKTAVYKNFILFVGFSIVLEFSILPRVISVTADPSLCTQFESYTNQRYVSYIETYKVRKWFTRRIATRINYRWEPYTDLRVIHKCCDGYKPENSITNCVPICPSGCNNGECYKPNVCKCFSGFVHSLNTRSGYLECVPHCSSGCEGGTCTAPEVCTCNSGYELTKDQRSCEPLCLMSDIEVINHGCGDYASCIAPNICECHHGYKKNPNGTQPLCRPICNPPCGSNAFCDAPNKCICDFGYIDANSFSTVNPTSMSYYDDTMTELPFSSTTETSPSMLCVPTCVPDCGMGSSCIAPNICQCNYGYRSKSLLKGPAHLIECAPFCYPPCLDGQCVYPNECICNSGYEIQPPVEDHICVPICHVECDVHAICILPDQCRCYDGYFKNVTSGAKNHENVSTSICIPICPEGCPTNGKCIAPGQCACDAGYELVGEATVSSTITDYSINISSDFTTDYYSTDSTSHSNNANITYTSGDDTTYSSSDGMEYSSSSSSDITTDISTISPMFQQFCQPICEPTCPNGFICIAPPDQCQLEFSADRESNGTSSIENGADYCGDGNGTENGITCNTTETAVLSYATAGTVGTIAVLAIILGIGLTIHLTGRKRTKVATNGLDKSMVAIMDHSEASESLFTNDQSSYL